MAEPVLGQLRLKCYDLQHLVHVVFMFAEMKMCWSVLRGASGGPVGPSGVPWEPSGAISPFFNEIVKRL